MSLIFGILSIYRTMNVLIANMEIATDSELQSFFGESTCISVKVVEYIEPSSKSGKHQFIISEVKPDSLWFWFRNE